MAPAPQSSEPQPDMSAKPGQPQGLEAHDPIVAANILEPESPHQTLSEADVRAIASYARIGLDPDELKAMTVYMNEAIELLRPIVEFDPHGVDPTFHPIGDLSNVMREDAPKAGLSLDAALENAHATEGRSFRVPSILGGGGLS